MKNSSERHTNSLLHETSPYLLQHAHNPVNWYPYGKEALELARQQNKPILISVGYSACHWCHVMAHESFEDEEVAALMNAYFINVKVDREERSDVDMLYMQAVQLMTGQGGWPLNCFTLPDGRPFYGGTYFQKKQWLQILRNLAEVYEKDPARVMEYATELTNGIRRAELISTSREPKEEIDRRLLKESVQRWKDRLDNEYGGPNRAPKFPLPSNYVFLMRYASLEGDRELMAHVDLTLTRMAFGGIYDQLHGGFARYSTDLLWKVPHFEKMLYDNAQLVSLYSEAYAISKNELYKEVVTETLAFIRNEWWNEAGYFYSAYDADSEGEEGKFYVWQEEELREVLQEDYSVFSRYYLIDEKGYWEHGNYILMRSGAQAQIMAEFGLSAEALQQAIDRCKHRLKERAKTRVKPGLDDKTICSWNALMATACAKAYLSFRDPVYRQMALSCLDFIENTLAKEGCLYRSFKKGQIKIEGFLEDYAFYAEALLQGYLISGEERYLKRAENWTGIALNLFHHPESPLLYYTASKEDALIERISETSDNVIPASNSQMAINLFVLGRYFGNRAWEERAVSMLRVVAEDLKAYGAGYSNWACLGLYLTYPFRELAIVGNNVDEIFSELTQQGLTNTIFALSAGSSDLPLVKDRFVHQKTLIYVCENNTCQLPVETVEEALQQLA